MASTKAPPAAPAVEDTGILPVHTRFHMITDELDKQFYERTDLIRVIAQSVLSAEHVFLLGEPGVAKTAIAEAFCERIEGGKFWSILMDRQLGKEDSFGPNDIALYEKTGVWQRDTEDTLLDAHLVVVDEIGKAGPASLNPYLRAFNERKFRNGKTAMDLPLITAIGTSNELLEPELSAMFDRFVIRCKVDRLRQESNRLALLQDGASTGYKPKVHTTITLDELHHAIGVEVPSVTLPAASARNILKLGQKLEEEGVFPSDRRWKKSVRLLQASAWLDGRSSVDEEDLDVLKHVLWTTEEEYQTVQSTVVKFTGPTNRKVADVRIKMGEIEASVSNVKGKNSEDRTKIGAEAQFKLTTLRDEVNKEIEMANREGRPTAKFEGLLPDIAAIRKTVLVDCLQVNPDRAAASSGL